MEGVRAIGLEDGVRAALLLAGVGAVLSAVGFLQRSSTGSAAPKFTRAAKVSVTKLVLVQVVLVGGLYSYFIDGGWTLESVGVSSGLSPAIAFVVGLGEFVLFSTVVRLFFYMRGSPLSYWQAILRTNTRFILTKRSQRIAMIGVGLVNPVTEELIFRGLLVHQLAITGAPMWFALALGALANAANHAYQGRPMVGYHLAFYSCVVGLLYSPIGLVGAVGFHLGADLAPFIGFRAQLRAYREARRARRSNSGLQQTWPSLRSGPGS